MSRLTVQVGDLVLGNPVMPASGCFAIEYGEADTTYKAISAIRRRTRHPLWAKLTPNAASIASVARAAEEASADAIVTGNTALGMAIDIRTHKPKLGNVMGGLSGPAIKPIAVSLVYQCYRAVRIPIIGCGGVQTADDVVEFMLAGASAVQVGPTSFRDPGVMQKIIDDLDRYCIESGVEHLSTLTGQVKVEYQLRGRWLRFAQQSG